MGAIRPTGDRTFEIVYGGQECPFLGLDSSAPPAYINPGNFVTIQNALVVDKAVVVSSLGDISDFQATNPRPLDINLGIGDLNGIVFEVYLDNASPRNIRVYSYQGIHGLGSNPSLIGTLALTAGVPIGNIGTLNYKNINGICYFSFAGCDSIFQHNNAVATLLTNYLGGAYLGELNGRLIVLNVTQTTGGVPTNFPYQVAWSAPLGNYSQFNPLVGGLVTGAGFNNLPDVEDVLTGFFTTGPTGYCLRRQGITEMTPLSSGINPFDFNHLWASHKGIGCINPGTVAQFGSLGVFGSSTDIYTLGYDGINSILGKAKTAIMPLVLDTINNPTIGTKSTIGPIIINNNTMTAYIIGTSLVQDVPPYAFFVYVFEMKEWFYINSTQNIVNPLYINFASLNTTTSSSNPETVDIFIYEIVTANTNVFFTLRPANITDISTLVFQAEEVSFERDITINGLGFYAFGQGGETVTFNISGNPFFNQVLLPGWNYYKISPNPNLYTGFTPQLTVTATGGILGKVTLFGMYDKTQLPL